jgi:hypothetical protein
VCARAFDPLGEAAEDCKNIQIGSSSTKRSSTPLSSKNKVILDSAPASALLHVSLEFENMSSVQFQYILSDQSYEQTSRLDTNLELGSVLPFQAVVDGKIEHAVVLAPFVGRADIAWPTSFENVELTGEGANASSDENGVRVSSGGCTQSTPDGSTSLIILAFLFVIGLRRRTQFSK